AGPGGGGAAGGPGRRARRGAGRDGGVRGPGPADRVEGPSRRRRPGPVPGRGRGRRTRGGPRRRSGPPLASAVRMADAPDRRERLLNLLAALLETRAGLTREEIVTNGTLGYPPAREAARKAFDRGQAGLRATGV